MKGIIKNHKDTERSEEERHSSSSSYKRLREKSELRVGHKKDKELPRTLQAISGRQVNVTQV